MTIVESLGWPWFSRSATREPCAATARRFVQHQLVLGRRFYGLQSLSSVTALADLKVPQVVQKSCQQDFWKLAHAEHWTPLRRNKYLFRLEIARANLELFDTDVPAKLEHQLQDLSCSQGQKKRDAWGFFGPSILTTSIRDLELGLRQSWDCWNAHCPTRGLHIIPHKLHLSYFYII